MSDKWTATTLGEIADINPEATKGWGQDKPIRYIDLGTVSFDGGISLDSTNEILYGDAPGRARRVVRTADVLVATVRPYLRGFAQVPAELDGEVASTGFAVIRAKEVAEPGYLWALVRTDQFVDFLMERATGSNYPAVRANDIADFPLSLPPVDAQRRVADVMSSIDAAIVGGEAYAATTRALRDSIIRTEYEADGTSVTLGSLCGDTGIQIGPFGSQLHQSDYTEGGVPVVMPANMKDGMIQEEGIARIPESKAEELRRHRLLPGDILLPRRGDLSKRAFVEEKHEGWLCGTGSARVRVSGVNPEAVYRAISTPSATRWLYENAVGTTMPNLNTTIVSNLPLRFPPDPGAPLSSLRALDEAISRAVELVSSLRGWRRSCLASLLSGTRAIPDSYDRFLEEAS